MAIQELLYNFYITDCWVGQDTLRKPGARVMIMSMLTQNVFFSHQWIFLSVFLNTNFKRTEIGLLYLRATKQIIHVQDFG